MKIDNSEFFKPMQMGLSSIHEVLPTLPVDPCAHDGLKREKGTLTPGFRTDVDQDHVTWDFYSANSAIEDLHVSGQRTKLEIEIASRILTQGKLYKRSLEPS